MTATLSLLDLALVGRDETPAHALHGCVEVARRAEHWGLQRVWYAEHHNMRAIASSATSVLIGHVAAHTETIRLGAGGIMLPNHAPLTIAEQFGTLASLHPGRIDLGLGRAPGTDQETLRALRRSPAAAERFGDDVLELQGYLGDESRIPGIEAIPGAGTHVPLYILGSSLFGARLAAALGLPYAFASHFAPDALVEAVATYRREFRPSAQLDSPYVIAGVNVIADEDPERAATQFQDTRRRRAQLLVRGARKLSDEELDLLLDAQAGPHVDQMLRYSAVGTGEEVLRQLDEFAAHADADELIMTLAAPRRQDRLHALELVGAARRALAA
jgi:luciferase family oxidoreductase group 1